MTRSKLLFKFCVIILSTGLISSLLLTLTLHIRDTPPSQNDSRDEVFNFSKYLLENEENLRSDPSYDATTYSVARINNHEGTENYDRVGCVAEPTVLECEGIGLAALLLYTLDQIGMCHLLGAKPTVIWKNCETVCAKGSFNSWEWYFQSINKGIERRASRAICMTRGLGTFQTDLSGKPWKYEINGHEFKPSPLIDLSFRPRSAEGAYRSQDLITKDMRLWGNMLVKEYLKINAAIQKAVDTFFCENMVGYNLLAVHVRGTDHVDETDSPTLPPLSAWIQQAEMIYNKMSSPKRIFVASDNAPTVKRFAAHFGSQNVVFTHAYRSSKYEGKAVHASGLDPYTIGSQVLMDILLMAKCHHFLHAESSVAALVTYWNLELKSHFMELAYLKEPHWTKPTPMGSPTGRLTARERNEFINEANRHEYCLKLNGKHSACPNTLKGMFMGGKELARFAVQK